MSIHDVLDVGIRIFPLVTSTPPPTLKPFPIETAPLAFAIVIGRKAFQLPSGSPDAVKRK
jgi:hypothetical protein